MGEPVGILIVPVGFNPSDEERAITVDVNDYLHTVLTTGLTGGGMGEPVGPIAVVAGYNPSGELRTVELDADDNLLITLLGGAANQILSSDGTKFSAADLAAVIKAAILDTNLGIIVRDSNGDIVSLDTPGTDQVVGESGGELAFIDAAGGGAWTLIEDKHLTALTEPISFTNIPGTYKHLAVWGSLRDDRSADDTPVGIQLNGDTGSNYYSVAEEIIPPNTISTNAQSASAYMRMFQCVSANAPANIFSPFKLEIMDYTDATNHVGVMGYSRVMRDTGTTQQRFFKGGGNWDDNGPVTQIDIMLPNGDEFIAGCRASLYGIG